jgi:hypothetical protein
VTKPSTLTFKDGAYSSAPVAIVVRQDRNSPTTAGASNCSWTTTTTQLVITTNFTPAAGGNYKFAVLLIG